MNQSIVGNRPRSMFIDYNNTIFVAAHDKDQLLIWSEGSTAPPQTISVPLSEHASLFVAVNGDVYFEKGEGQGKIYTWTNNQESTVLVKEFNEHCFGLFVDIHNTLYCSVHHNNKVISTSLSSSNNNLIIVAGASSNELKNPYGIFVGTKFDLYVADWENHRIQLFRPRRENGTTVAGNMIPPNLTLNHPTDVVVDVDGYLYIVDSANNRIIRSGFGKHQCLVGCTSKNGLTPDQLNQPDSIRFDSYGNFYVTDTHNHRIQKFTLATNSCGKSNKLNYNLHLPQRVPIINS
jgi:sugar lactone lactonase YvrE